LRTYAQCWLARSARPRIERGASVSGTAFTKPDRAAYFAAVESAFAAGGPFARAVPGYRERTQQVEFARRVAGAIADHHALIAEAGTGTGKTFAYLVPALLSGGKVIISTGTKTLQDQLYGRDLPAVRDALGLAVTATLLKGRANYVCHYHLERNLKDGRLPSREAVRDLHVIARFARTATRGDRSELDAVAEDASAWALATSTRENCLGQNCPNARECFVTAARREAMAAEVVIVNHHLFFADVMLREEGLAELLPACNTVVFDEAHQLPETATQFFGESVSTAQVIDLGRDTLAEIHAGARDVAELPTLVRAADRAARDLRLAVPGREMRLPAAQLEAKPEFAPAVQAFMKSLTTLTEGLRLVAERSEGLASCAQRATELLERAQRWRDAEEGDRVRWADVRTQALALHSTPLAIAPAFRKQMEGRPRSWIFTSATLAMRGDFSLYQREMGLDEAETACWDSPFDYPRNGLLYVPAGLPEPNTPHHTDAVVDHALKVLRASRGRAFLLFTTLRGMQHAARRVREALAAAGLEYPVLAQGEGSRTALLDRFRALGNAVLVASQSFWEGVDVRGDALSLVVIDKLPFAPPDDPVLAARLAHLRREGRNPFTEYQLPQAAIVLKQGAGRLIRDESDRGVLMICDPRLASKPYGRVLVASLPPMRRTRELAEVEAFFESAALAPTAH